jgi:hypothetical protein
VQEMQFKMNHDFQYLKNCPHVEVVLTRFAWWQQDLHAIELLRAHIGEWTMTQMLD